MKKRRFRKPYRIKRKKPILKNRVFWRGATLFLIFFTLFYLVCFSSRFQIKEIKISGTQKVPKANLENIVWRLVEKKIFLFPSQSIFLIDFEEIKKETLGVFPQIAQIKLKRQLPDILILQVEEREVVTIFYQDDKNFFVDKTGVLFEEIPVVDTEFLRIKNPTLQHKLELGKKIIEEEKLSKILELELKLKKDFQIQPQEVLIISEERWNTKTSGGWEIYLDPQDSLDWQLTKLKAVLEEEIPPERRKDLEYIELRFGNLASFKYK